VLNLPTTSTLLQLVTGAAVSSISVHASWMDMSLSGTAVDPGSANTQVSSATTATIVSPPGPGVNRNVKFLSVQNTSAVACPVAIQHFDGANAINLFAPTTLPAGWTIQYNTDGVGFVLYDQIGNIRETLGGSGGGGATGPAGPTGPAGSSGTAGPTGPAGSAGSAGPTGSPGGVGPTGPAGAAGSTGAAGSVGPTGPQGFTGASGAVGPTGPTGPRGFTGSQGFAGSTGPTGPQGTAGSTGSTGPIGIGLTGPSSPGTTGPTGPTGASPSFTNITVIGSVTNIPISSAPVTIAQTLNLPYTAQTTPGGLGFTNILVATIPLPGTAGAPIPKGQLDFDYDAAVTGTTTAVGARFRGYVSYTVQVSGSPAIIGIIEQPIAIGTNASAIPSAWNYTIALDGASKNILVTVTTDGSDTYDVSMITQQRYTQ
jgi:hypothetical protein